jgi:hypothetical protein
LKGQQTLLLLLLLLLLMLLFALPSPRAMDLALGLPKPCDLGTCCALPEVAAAAAYVLCAAFPQGHGPSTWPAQAM